MPAGSEKRNADAARRIDAAVERHRQAKRARNLPTPRLLRAKLAENTRIKNRKDTTSL